VHDYIIVELVITTHASARDTTHNTIPEIWGNVVYSTSAFILSYSNIALHWWVIRGFLSAVSAIWLCVWVPPFIPYMSLYEFILSAFKGEPYHNFIGMNADQRLVSPRIIKRKKTKQCWTSATLPLLDAVGYRVWEMDWFVLSHGGGKTKNVKLS